MSLHFKSRRSLGITVDTSLCSFDDAACEAIKLAATYTVELTHGSAVATVGMGDSVDDVRERWQREADRQRALKDRVRDGRARIAHDLRDAGFGSADWTYDDREFAITLSVDDAKRLLARSKP